MDKNKKNQIEELSKEEVFNVLEFANKIYNSNTLGAITPSLLNANLNSLNNNPKIPISNKDINDALANFVNQAKTLQGYTEFAESMDMLFKRSLNYYANILSFDLSYTVVGADEKDFNTQEFKEDKRRVEKFFESFDYNSEFLKVLKNILRNETYYVWFRTNEGKTSDLGEDKTTKLPKYTLQMMPQEYCMITGYCEYGLLYDVNMNYFLKAGVNINGYDPIFKKYYRETYGDIVEPNYNSTAQFKERNGQFAMWHQTSPEAGAWCFKFDESNFNATPFLAPMIKNVLTDAEITALQKDADILSAFGILAGEIPLLDKQKSGQVRDAMAWNPNTWKKFMQLVAAGLKNNIKAIGMPVENLDFYQFENKNPNMLENQLKTTSGTGVSASRVIYSSDKVSQAELEAQITNDYNIVSKVYRQFETFLDYYVNRKLRKYKYKFHFSGSTYPFINKTRNDGLISLANMGIVLNPTAYACIVGMKPNEFEASLREGHYGGFKDLLTPLISLHNQSANQNVGRPESEDLTDGGATAREYDD